VFVDRDGTVLDETGYVTPATMVRVYPYSIDAIRLLVRGGFAVVVVTNQGAIGLGLCDRAFVERTHASLAARFDAGGARVAGWYYCPHHPDAIVAGLDGPCECRKPRPGLVAAGLRDLHLDPAASWVVGDQWRDIELAHRVGARSVLVRTGYGRRTEAHWPETSAPPTFVAENLIAAAGRILDG
jgi:D-glycero-D-manno-heptose 1,7-bisphosphate phosphatase